MEMQVVLREELHCIKQSGELAVVATGCVAPDLFSIAQKLGSVMVSALNSMANESPHPLKVADLSGRQEDKEEQVSADVLAHDLSQFVVVPDRHRIVVLSGQVRNNSWAKPS